jgi:hypothetical protein
MISPDFDIEETLEKLDINQKVKLLAGLVCSIYCMPAQIQIMLMMAVITRDGGIHNLSPNWEFRL